MVIIALSRQVLFFSFILNNNHTENYSHSLKSLSSRKVIESTVVKPRRLWPQPHGPHFMTGEGGTKNDRRKSKLCFRGRGHRRYPGVSRWSSPIFWHRKRYRSKIHPLRHLRRTPPLQSCDKLCSKLNTGNGPLPRVWYKSQADASSFAIAIWPCYLSFCRV